MDATRLGEIASAQAQRLLVIRAMDDEASLTMALGAVFTYVTARAISYILGVFSVLALIFFFISLWVEWHSTTLVVGFTAFSQLCMPHEVGVEGNSVYRTGIAN